MKTKSDKKPMTADEARSFSCYSAANGAIATITLKASGVCDGTCDPYTQIFTFNRWLAQGYAVQKGQHGAKLGIVIPTTKTEIKDGKEVVVETGRPWSTTVFCFHQVRKVEVRP